MVDDEDDASSVRPYAVMGARTKAMSSVDLPIEALVEGLVAPDVKLTPERRRILELTATQYLSIMELSAHVKLPVGVVRVLVSDLVEPAQGPDPRTDPVLVHHWVAPDNTAATLSVLESVLNGISSL